MRNKQEVTGISPQDRLRQAFSANRVVFELAGSAAAGFVMANSFLLGGVAPFGVALPAALPGKYAHCAALGALLGYVFSSNMLGNIKYVVALLLVVVVKWLLENKLGKAGASAWCVVTAFVAMVVSSAAIIFTMDYTMYDILTSVAEIALASGSAYFLSRTLAAAENGIAGASRADLSCMVVSMAVLLMGFSGFRIAGLSLGRILAVLVILSCARYGGEAMGAIAGITAGIAIGLTGKDFGYVVAAYAFGGLLSGVFHQTGRVAVAGVFIVVNALAALFVGQAVDVYTAVLEIFVASVAFMAIPAAWIKRLQGALARPGASDSSTQALLRAKLSSVSRTLRDIGDTTRQVSQRLSKMESAGLDSLQTRVEEKVCGRCGSRTSCWEFHRAETDQAMADTIRVLKKEGSVNRANLPRYLSKSCCKLDMLAAEANAVFRDQVAREGVQRRVGQVRSVMTDQFESLALMLDEMSGELGSIRQAEPQRVARLREYLRKENFGGDKILCYTDEYDRMKVEIRIPTYQLARVNKPALTLDISGVLEADFDLPQVDVNDKEVALLFHEKATYSVELGAYQMSSGGQKLCGDAYSFIREQGGSAHLILSDGMGSGGSAAVDSSMATSLLTQMLSVGIRHEAALKLVNSALLVKSGDESLATIDICTMDLFTGKSTFYKAGAAPSFIIRNGRAGYVESTSLPAGILRGVSFEKSAATLRAGDTVVLISDGVIATGAEWVLSELEHLRANHDNQGLCERLAVTAKQRREDGREDDITVLAATLQKGV